MEQFPSVTERRSNTFGSGIVSRTPRPAGVTLTVDPETWLPGAPFGNRFRQAAMIERYRTWPDVYAEIAARYTGEDSWIGTAQPHPYRPEDMQSALFDLWQAYLDGQERAYGWVYYRVGDNIVDQFANPPVTPIIAATPTWGPDELLEALQADLETSVQWDTLADGSFCGALIDKGPWRARAEAQDHDDPDLTEPEQNIHYNGEARLAGAGLPLSLLCQQLLIWGECPAPDQVGYEEKACPPSEPGSNELEWLAYLATVAGRILYQMAFIEYSIMVDDSCNFKPGGKGGTTGPGTERKPGALKPGSIITPPPLNIDQGEATLNTLKQIDSFSHTFDDAVTFLTGGAVGQ